MTQAELLDGMPPPPPGLPAPVANELRAATAAILLERYRFARQAGISFDGARDLYEVLGYDRVITNKQYRERYQRGGIAGRIVDVMPDATWRGEVWLEEDEDPEVSTPFEEAWAALDQRLQLQAKFLRVDKLARMSTYAVLLLGVAGEEDFAEEMPRGGPDDLMYVTPFSGGGGARGDSKQQVQSIDADCSVFEYETDPRNKRFGLPRSYQLRRTDITSPLFQRPVHWSRIIHIAEGLLDDEVFGQPALERVWNLLDDLDKVTGGGAEAFWLRANQGLHLDIDKDLALPAAKDAIANLKEQSELYKHQLTRWLRTRGVNVQTLGSDVANFANPADAVLTQIAGAKAIPKRILTGSEMGELASSQDRENFRDQIVGRQKSYAGPTIVRQFADRLIAYGYLPTPREGVHAYEVKWPQIQVLTEDEKARGAKDWATTVINGEPVFVAPEIREKWYGMQPLTDEQIESELERREKLAPKPEPAPEAPVEEERFPRAAEGDEEILRVLEAAIRADNEEVIAEIIGVTHRAAGFNADQPRDNYGKWTDGGGGSGEGGSKGDSKDMPLPKNVGDGFAVYDMAPTGEDDPDDLSIKVSRRKDGFYMEAENFDALAKDEKEVVAKLKKWGAKYVGWENK